MGVFEAMELAVLSLRTRSFLVIFRSISALFYNVFIIRFLLLSLFNSDLESIFVFF